MVVIDTLYWDKERILEDLKENFVKIDENGEVMWYKWKIVHINLPEVTWIFGWYKFDYFVSEDLATKRDFKMNPEFENKLCSINDVSQLLKAVNMYMKVLGVETDESMDYENSLKCWETNIYGCCAWDCLKYILWEAMWLDDMYWLKDKDSDNENGSHAIWFCNDDNCFFDWDDDCRYANLFFRWI